MDHVRSTRIRLGDVSRWIFTEEAINIGCELVEQFVCSTNSQFSTVKRISWQRDHGDKI
jgi:hypothetical protein